MEDLSISSLRYLHWLFNIPAANRTQENLEEVMKYTKDNKFLKKISEERNSNRILWECCRVMTLEVYQKGEPIINFGEIGDRFYIIIKGKARVITPTRSLHRAEATTRDLLNGLKRMNTLRETSSPLITDEKEAKFNEEIKTLTRQKTEIDIEFLANYGEIEEFKHVNTLKEGDFFGELALINNKPRTATIEASEVCYLAVLSKKDFKKILCNDALKSLEERVNLLKSLPAFSDLSKLSLQKFVYSFSEITYKKDQILFDENFLADCLYFVKSGEIKIFQRDFVATPKYTKPDVFLRLGMMKTQRKRVNVKEVIKGKNEIIGYEEILEKRKNRIRVCSCYSNFVIVYEVKIEVLKRFPFYNEVMEFLQNKYKNDDIRASQMVMPLKEIEKFKQTCKAKAPISRNVQNILYTMRDKEKQVDPQSKKHHKCTSSLSSLEKPTKSAKPCKRILIKSSCSPRTIKTPKLKPPLPIDLFKNCEITPYFKNVLKGINKKSAIESLTFRNEGFSEPTQSQGRFDLKCLLLNDFIF